MFVKLCDKGIRNPALTDNAIKISNPAMSGKECLSKLALICQQNFVSACAQESLFYMGVCQLGYRYFTRFVDALSAEKDFIGMNVIEKSDVAEDIMP